MIKKYIDIILAWIWNFLNRKALEKAKENLKESNSETDKKVKEARDAYNNFSKSLSDYKERKRANMRRTSKPVQRSGGKTKASSGRKRKNKTNKRSSNSKAGRTNRNVKKGK